MVMLMTRMTVMIATTMLMTIMMLTIIVALQNWLIIFNKFASLTMLRSRCGLKFIKNRKVSKIAQTRLVHKFYLDFLKDLIASMNSKES